MDFDVVYIKRVSLKGIHQRYDLDVSFNKTLNVLHGHNGTGKSTLIHIIANIANRDFLRFAYLSFDEVLVEYSNRCKIEILRHGAEPAVLEVKYFDSEGRGSFFEFLESDAFKSFAVVDEEKWEGREPRTELTSLMRGFLEGNNVPEINNSYFPAFRAMLEAWSSQVDEEMRRFRGIAVKRISVKKVTSFARGLFGKFLPEINYPSPLSIESNVKEEIREAQLKIAQYESSVFSNSFVKVFSAILQDGTSSDLHAEDLLREISELTTESAVNKLVNYEGPSNAYAQLQQLVGASRASRDLASSATGALVVYRDALRERRSFQESIFEELDKYFAAVNNFLEQKTLRYVPDTHRRIPRVGLQFPDGSWSSIRVMSSGERQLLTMLYAVTKMSADTLVLIDEPELSLHIDWQEELLEKMMDQLGNRQIIVCTHSPAIASSYQDCMIEVVPILSSKYASGVDSVDEDEELI
ncbi:AAA family ATPase [Pseudomonas sp. SORT22]|uniref:AAA family ATPase n=1 Tax=Pseudomonas sp. SORT22 TaxID=2813842 RepID=UPI001BCDA928|nr:AAA family ATPase [Pseudomonas sp. SORT22]QVM98736.1 AAA family ATPase [Pseudomonas sp. SORT22]